ncbi:MAG: hypothetical protein ACREH8_16990 [Opitutaceae bacterium]
MSTSRRIFIWIVCLALIVGGGIGLARRLARTAAQPAIVATKKPIERPTLSAPTPSTFDRVDIGSSIGTWSFTDQQRRQLEAAIATGNPFEWKPLMAELLNDNYKLEEAIAVLSGFLNHSAWEVRVAAARLLLELGSTAGVPVLNAALHAAAIGELSVDFAEASAGSLHRFRQAIDPKDLYQCYARFRTLDLLIVATMQQVPEMRDLVREWRVTNQSAHDKDWMAAYLDMRDAESIARYERRISSNDPRSRLLGHWALYRALGRPEHLDYVISSARQIAGLEPRKEENQPWTGTMTLVFEFLSITIDPKTTKALEEIADIAAKHPNGSYCFSLSFAPLYYLHKDNAFVNRRVMEFLRGEYRGPGVDRQFMLVIAAERRTPEIDALARAFNALAYEYALSTARRRPVEGWGMSMTHVPVTVAPPLDMR